MSMDGGVTVETSELVFVYEEPLSIERLSRVTDVALVSSVGACDLAVVAPCLDGKSSKRIVVALRGGGGARDFHNRVGDVRFNLFAKM